MAPLAGRACHSACSRRPYKAGEMSTWPINSNIALTDGSIDTSSSHPFSILCSGDTFILQTPRTIAHYNDKGCEGEMCFDFDYLYLYRTGRWTRVSLDQSLF